MPNPHDRFVKEALTRLETAQDLARNYLPAEVVARLDLDSMELVKDSWVDAELREHFADVLYQLNWRDPGIGTSAFLYLLFEHKSQPEKNIAVQLLQYMAQQWQAHLKSESLPLPFILPLVLYHGESEWRVPHTFESLFGEIPPELQVYVPHFSYELLDISLHSDREIVGGTLVRATLSLLHSIYAPDLAARLPEILKALATRDADAIELVKTFLRYVTEASPLDQAEVALAVNASLQAKVSDLMPTLAEKWVEQGKRSALLSMLMKQANRKFGAMDAMSISQLESLPTSDVEQLGEIILDLTSLTDLRDWITMRLHTGSSQ